MSLDTQKPQLPFFQPVHLTRDIMPSIGYYAKIVCLAVLPGILLSTCVKDVTLDAGDRTVVVECVLCDVSHQELRLSFSRGASESAVEELTEAVVRLIDLTESKTVGEFRRDADGIWRLDYTAVPLHLYRLEVEVPGFDMVYAEDKMPDLVTINAHGGEVVNMDDRVRRLVPLIPDEKPKYDMHSTWFSYPVSINTNEHNPHSLSPNIWIYGIKLNPASGEYELADKICCTSNGGECDNQIDGFNVTDEVYKAPLISTDFPFEYGAVKYPTYLSFYHNLDGCPIHKGYIKINADTRFFAKVHIWCDFFDMETIEKDFMTLANSDHCFSENIVRLMSLREYLTDIEGAILNCEFEPSLSDGYIVFKYVSDTYDKYFEEALFQLRRQDKKSSDMSEMSIYMRENIYSNVKGGAGIFAASTEKRIPLAITPDIIYDFSNPL